MSVSLNELSYRIFNIILPKLSDDESIDISEIRYDIENTRALLLKRNYGHKFISDIPENIVQRLGKLEIESVNSSNVFLEIPSGKVLMRTKLKVPKIMLKSSGLPLIKRISASTILSNNFSVVTPEQATTCGYGKFNAKNIFCFYENDYLYFVTNRTLFKGVKYIDLYSVFERPTKVYDFLNLNYSINQNSVLYDPNLPYDNESPYPIQMEMIDDIEQIIIKNKLRIESTQPIDDVNDSSDTGK